MNTSKVNWGKYILEFLSIFIAVVSAFALSNWNDNRKSELSEQKILTEIKNGIEKDNKDFEGNIYGHTLSLRANEVFRDLINNQPISQDSIRFYYVALFRDYSPIVNRSGYESLKEAGLKTIANDSLRLQIISLYDYHYGIVAILDNVHEMQSFENYFAKINNHLHPYMEFNENGNLINIKSPRGLGSSGKKEILSYLWRLENNRKYKIGKYRSIIEVMKKVKKSVENEISL